MKHKHHNFSLLTFSLLAAIAGAPGLANAQTTNTQKFDPVRAAREVLADPAKPAPQPAAPPAPQPAAQPAPKAANPAPQPAAEPARKPAAQPKAMPAAKAADPAAMKPNVHLQPVPSYLIGAGDIVAVNVWQEKEISQKLAVRPDGMISLPLIGDVSASGETPESLAASITDKLKTYLNNPQVTVMVLEVHSKWFVVMGEVNKAGRFTLNRPITVMEALSEAGGFHEFAKTNKIYVLHNVGGKIVRVPFHYKKVVKGQNLNENIEVHDGDTIVVP